jgi:Tfp pilus assembly protein PilW
MHKHRISGISLIELLIALLLGTFLMLSGYQLLENQIVFMKNAMGSAEDEDLIIFTENILTKNIENAGYFGCQTMNHAIVASALSDYSTLPPMISVSPAKDGSDILTIRSEDTNTTYLTKKMASAKTVLYLASNHFTQGDIAIIGDCGKSDIFKVGTVHGLQMNHVPFSQAYDMNATVGSFKTTIFYVDNGSLFYNALGDHAQELVPNITKFNVFLNAASVKFELTFLNHQHKPQAFSFFVSLRND